MTSDDPNPAEAVVQAAQVPAETSPQVYKENNTNTNQLQPLHPPEIPLPPSGTTGSGMRAPESISLPEKYQNALCHIHILETHNAKLYEDNCRLVNAVNMLNDRLTFLGAPQNTQMLRLADLQEKLRMGEANWVSVNRKYQELLQSISAGSAKNHIGMELQTIRDAYALLDREYRLLGDKYLRLKAVADTSRVVQQQPQGTASVSHNMARGHVPKVRTEFANATQLRVHAYDRSRNNAFPASVATPRSFPPFPDENPRLPNADGVTAQPPIRAGPAPIATTWVAPLPTPPPSAPLLGGQISPTGFPVHTPVPVGSLLLPPHGEPPSLSGIPVAYSRHLVKQDDSERLNAADRLCQGSSEDAKITNHELVPCGNLAPTLVNLSPRPPKRPIYELQTSTSPEEHKKPRIEGEVDHSTTVNADTYATGKVPSLVASTDLHDDCKLSVSDPDVRSYQDCVNLIFENDADVENGVFCGLCLDRYEAKMIQEPPDVLVQPEFGALVKHCRSMHPTVWDDLLHKA